MAGLKVLAPLVAAAAAAWLAACGGGAGAPAADATRAARATSLGGRREVASNVRFEDYAGTKACEPCHAAYVTSWLASPMHAMTRDARTATVRGPFGSGSFTFKDDAARLEMDGETRFVTLRSARHGSGTWRVTKVIGGHHREDYVGLPVAEPRAGAAPLATPDEEVVLPVSFVFAPGGVGASAPKTAGALRYKGYSVMVKERTGLKVGPTWRQTCIFCHNTVPYLSTVLGAVAGKGARPYQGEVVDPLLPEALRASYVVTDPAGLSRALAAETARLGAHGPATAEAAISATRSRFGEKHLVELGIGCEACHLGAAEHARDPSAVPSLEPRASFLEVRTPKGRPADRINRACARCHQVLFSGYEHTWEGGSRRAGPGGSNINSGEARDLMLGACASELSCVGCHEPHAKDATASLRSLDAAGKDALCTRCHGKLAAPEALRAHAHHDPGREGARCVGCHMPEKTMSLDGTLTAYHRIGSPTDPARVLLDRPVECALCHADASVEKLVSTMERWWGKRYDRDALRKLYGDLDANALRATAARGKPHEQGVAYHALGRARSEAALPELTEGLRHPYPLVRGYAKRALDAVAGAPLPIDIDADDAALEAQIRAWEARRPAPPRAGR